MAACGGAARRGCGCGVYLRDFYDARCLVTSPAEWGDEWQKCTLLFVRGAALPVPPYPGAKGSKGWHARSTPSERDATQPCLARGLAQQLAPDGSGSQPVYAVEVERMAAAWHAAGLPLPADYSAAEGRPHGEEERVYARSRGAGDGRRAAGVVPLLALPAAERDARIAACGLSPAVQDALRTATTPRIRQRGFGLGARARARLVYERAAQPEPGILLP